MGEIIKSDNGGPLTKFEPDKARMAVASLKGAIKQARAMKDWAAGECAIEELIAWQSAFVAWWKTAITPGQSSGNNQHRSIPKAGLTAADALAATGISPQHVKRWKDRLEDVDEYRIYLRRALQTVALSKDPKQEETDKTVVPDGKYACIVIDPPWPMQKIERVVAPNQTGFDYPTMTKEELLQFGNILTPVLHDDCHVFLWTTEKYLPMAEMLLGQWRLKYVLTMVWHKTGGFQPFGLPQYNCEFVVYGRNGSPTFLETKDFFCCFEGERREHSRKPNEFYDTIRRVTGGPRLDMFSRELRDGFDQWGNQTKVFGTICHD